MKTRVPLLLLPSALLLGGFALPMPSAAPANDVIEQAMGQLAQATKALGKGIDESSRESALAELEKIERALISAKAATPDTAAAVDEKKRAEFVAGFRTKLLEALKVACDAEIAVVDGKYGEAEKLVKNKLGAIKSAGHDEYKGKD